jgi:hypothetical protein
MLSVVYKPIKLSVILLNVVMLNVMAPSCLSFMGKIVYCHKVALLQKEVSK